jgi:hypothetical protein
MLLIFKDEQASNDGKKYKEILFVQERNAQREQWDGKRLGTEGTKEKLGLNMSLNGKDFKISLLIFQNLIRSSLHNYQLIFVVIVLENLIYIISLNSSKRRRMFRIHSQEINDLTQDHLWISLVACGK